MSGNHPSPQLTLCIARARGFLMAKQNSEGLWDEPPVSQPLYTARFLICARYLDILDTRTTRQAIRWLLARQLADGSYADIHESREMALMISAEVHAAIACNNLAREIEPQQAAWAFIKNTGGYRDLNHESKIMLCLAGRLPAAQLPALARRFNPQLGFIAALMPFVAQALKSTPAFGHALLHPWQARAARKARRFLLATQNPQGDWGGQLMLTLWGLLAGHFLGLKLQHKRMRKALASLSQWQQNTEDGLYMRPFLAPVSTTAAAVKALLASGSDAHETRITKAADFLLQQQSQLETPKHCPLNLIGGQAAGGWSRSANNYLLPDIHSSNLVIGALAELYSSHDEVRLEHALQRAGHWLMNRQQADGAWLQDIPLPDYP